MIRRHCPFTQLLILKETLYGRPEALSPSVQDGPGENDSVKFLKSSNHGQDRPEGPCYCIHGGSYYQQSDHPRRHQAVATSLLSQ
jgi:hypothetical protein